MEKQDTIADIIAEMRKSDCDEICPWWADGGSCDSCPLGRSGKNCSFSNFADRLEVAWKREKSAIEADALAVGGDAAKLREALLRCDAIAQLPEVRNEQSIKDMRNIIRQALAEPPRNCDVGTAEEQTRRMEAEYCHVQKSCYESPSGRECPLHKAEVDCRLIWAQMPYREGGAS